MLKKKQIKSLQKRNQSGFTMIEMLVAIGLFIIVTGFMYSLLELGRSDRNRTSRRGDTQKNARIAMYMIGRDVMNAGLGYPKQALWCRANFNKSSGCSGRNGVAEIC